MTFNAACAQFAPEKADVDQNLDKISGAIAQARDEGVDLLVFPETSTSGYFLEGGVLEASLSAQELAHKIQERLQPSQQPIDVVIGFYESFDGNLYNSAAYLVIGQSVEVVGVYRKFFLPTYGVFDEERFVARGRDLCLIATRFGKVAILICEDVWHGILPTLCAIKGAQILVVPSASPARGFVGDDITNHDRYVRLFRAIAEEHGVYCINAQLCGFEGGKGFIGGSMIVNPLGEQIALAPLAEESLLIAKCDIELVEIARAQTPLIADLQTNWSDLMRMASEA